MGVKSSPAPGSAAPVLRGPGASGTSPPSRLGRCPLATISTAGVSDDERTSPQTPRRANASLAVHGCRQAPRDPTAEPQLCHRRVFRVRGTPSSARLSRRGLQPSRSSVFGRVRTVPAGRHRWPRSSGAIRSQAPPMFAAVRRAPRTRGDRRGCSATQCTGLADELPGPASVQPTHGACSFCSITAAGDETTSTIERERLQNPALTARSTRRTCDDVGGDDRRLMSALII